MSGPLIVAEPGTWTPMFHIFALRACRLCCSPIARTRGSVEIRPGDQPRAYFNALLNAYECPGCRAEAARVAPAIAAACQEEAEKAAIGVPVAGPSEGAPKGTGDPGAAALPDSEFALTIRTDSQGDRVDGGPDASLD